MAGRDHHWKGLVEEGRAPLELARASRERAMPPRHPSVPAPQLGSLAPGSPATSRGFDWLLRRESPPSGRCGRDTAVPGHLVTWTLACKLAQMCNPLPRSPRDPERCVGGSGLPVASRGPLPWASGLWLYLLGLRVQETHSGPRPWPARLCTRQLLPYF